ncbi:PQQ-binding-like beta-propeller repeat protein [Actinoplanes sp. GCM10030250]|uniref:outer membrane protein assembly factor BamB family protein n=1 Tax=Actinoplanes sp. GCM10030250 TaxID=3273376 RepID=UPI003612A40C
MALAAGAAATPAAATPASLWDHPGYDAEDSYYNPAESVVNAGSIGRLTRKWSVNLRKSDESCSGPSAPVVAGGRIFASDHLGISTYGAADGKLNWRYDWPDMMDNDTPVMAVSDGLLIAANGDCNSQSDPDGQLTALDVATGKMRWGLGSDMPINSVVVDKGVVVISGWSQSDEDAVVAYRASDGKMLWHKPRYATTGVSANGVLLIHKTDGYGVPAGETAAVDIGGGATRWTRKGAWPAQAASPRADRFYVTAGGRSPADRSLVALDAATGAVVWTAAGKASELIAADGRRVYRAEGRAVEALDAGNGQRLWITQLNTDVVQPVRAGGLLYAGGAVLNASDGTVAGSVFGGRVVVTGGRIHQVIGSVLVAYAP